MGKPSWIYPGILLECHPAVQIYRIVTGRIAGEANIIAKTSIELEVMNVLRRKFEVRKRGQDGSTLAEWDIAHLDRKCLTIWLA